LTDSEANQKPKKAKIKDQKSKTNRRGLPMQTNLGERILEYAARIIRVVESLPKTLIGRRLGDQLLRSGTSVGANFDEAQAAESKDDFMHKLHVALKELRESNYWLRLLAKVGTLPQQRLAPLIDESSQLVAMLSKAVAKVKGKAKPATAATTST
jgi:four helix bundle protein